MRLMSTLCAAASLAVTAFVATAPAEAAFHLIRWQDTGFCQIWDESIPTTPFPANYTTIQNSATPTFLDALALKDGLVRKGACTF